MDLYGKQVITVVFNNGEHIVGYGGIEYICRTEQETIERIKSLLVTERLEK